MKVSRAASMRVHGISSMKCHQVSGWCGAYMSRCTHRQVRLEFGEQ